MAITTRQELAEYCLRNLGAPVIEINVDDDQLSDRIDEAIGYYREFHSDSVVPVYYKHQITATDLSNQYIELPDHIASVTRVLPLQSDGAGSGMFNVNYQMHLQDMFLLRGSGFIGGLQNYYQTKVYMELTNNLLGNTSPAYRYSRHMDRLHLDVDWGNLSEGEYVIIDAFSAIDPEVHTQVYNDYYLKKYTTALIKRQWGANMMKFDGMVLPGGVTFNGRQMFEDALAEIERLEEEMRLVWEAPVDFMVG